MPNHSATPAYCLSPAPRGTPTRCLDQTTLRCVQTGWSFRPSKLLDGAGGGNRTRVILRTEEVRDHYATPACSRVQLLGFEPTCPFRHPGLSQVRLPVPPSDLSLTS